MSKELNINDEADRIVGNYSFDKIKSVYETVQKEMHQQGCGCLHCVTSAVNEINSWIDWYVGEDPELEDYMETIRYKVDGRGHITQGCDFEMKFNDEEDEEDDKDEQ